MFKGYFLKIFKCKYVLLKVIVKKKKKNLNKKINLPPNHYYSHKSDRNDCT